MGPNPTSWKNSEGKLLKCKYSNCFISISIYLLEVVVESKYKGCNRRSEDRPVGHAGGVALPLLQEVHWVEDQGQGDDVEDHIINQVPEKGINIISESDVVSLPCDTHTAILIAKSSIHKCVDTE